GRLEAAHTNRELLARAARDRIGVARAALVLVEERTEPLLWREDAVEEVAAFFEPCQLLGSESGQRTSGLGRWRARGGRCSAGLAGQESGEAEHREAADDEHDRATGQVISR